MTHYCPEDQVFNVELDFHDLHSLRLVQSHISPCPTMYVLCSIQTGLLAVSQIHLVSGSFSHTYSFLYHLHLTYMHMHRHIQMLLLLRRLL